MTAKIAGQHGLEPVVASDVAAIALPHVDQVDESDIAVLTRVTRPHDAVAKPGGGRLVVARRAQGRSATGEAMPEVALTPREVTSWGASALALREPAGSVVATWRDRAGGVDREVQVGGGPIRCAGCAIGSPTRRRPRPRRRPSSDRASRAGEALQVDMPGRPRAGRRGAPHPRRVAPRGPHRVGRDRRRATP